MRAQVPDAPVARRLTCDHCGAAVFADGTTGGGYALEDGTWVRSWAVCGTCCRKPDARPLEVRR